MSGPGTGDPAIGQDSTEDGVLAEEFLRHVGGRIRLLRKDRGMTVQDLADLAGVSRRLLTQIEYGQANPSLVVITRIARRLNTDYSELLGLTTQSDTPMAKTAAFKHTLVWSSPAGSTALLLVSTPGGRHADMWRWELVPGDQYTAMPDPTGSFELFYVLTGQFQLVADDLEVTIAGGESGWLRSDRAYRYTNRGTTPAVFIRTVALARS